MEKATIYDYARMCESNKSNCECCPLSRNNNGTGIGCGGLLHQRPDKANEIILDWCKEHHIETRQDRFLKMFPNAKVFDNGIVAICPSNLDNTIKCKSYAYSCDVCRKEYWLAEVEENE